MELLPLVCLCLLSCSGDAVRVVVEEDSDAVLPCLISTKEDITGKLFNWSKDGQKVFVYDAGFHSEGEQFKGRVSFFQDQLQNGDASIKITRTKMADSGTYSCDFPRHQSRQTSIIELVVDPVLKDRTGENIPGAASKPHVKTIKTDKGVMLQCEVLGASPKPKVEWKDRSGNVLQTEEPQVTERGGIVLRAAVTKTDTFRCVVTQEEISHQIYAEIYASVSAVRVEEDSDAVLPCLISTKEDISGKLFNWSKDGQNVFVYDAGFHSEDEQFKGRVSFFQDQLQNGDASIKITRTKMADSGSYSCDFPRHQPRQTSIIELVVDPVLKDRTGENIPGAASAPHVKTIQTDKGVMLQCEVLGASPKPKVEWKDSSGNILQTEEPQVTERGGSYDIVLRAAVTKTDTFRCVVTQEEISHQIYAEIYASVSVQTPDPGSNTGWIIAGVVGLLFVVAVVAVVLYFKDRIRKICVKCSRRNRANGRTGTSERSSNVELLPYSDPAELIENHSAPLRDSHDAE